MHPVCLWSIALQFNTCIFHISDEFQAFPVAEGMKLGTIISVCDFRQRTHSKIHETHKIAQFPAPEKKGNLDHTHSIHD